MPELRYRVVIGGPTQAELLGLWDLAKGFGDEGTHWSFRDLGGGRFSFDFRRAGHAVLFRSGADRRGLTTLPG